MGHEPGRTFDVGDGAMFGRADGADIHVEDQFASSSHARIYDRGGAMYLEDMGSTNGTYLNGRKVQSAEPLGTGDTIRIGDSEYRYEE
jgi:pSer/pThr/pTyr-binding forkhead associated (FHA) protein